MSLSYLEITQRKRLMTDLKLKQLHNLVFEKRNAVFADVFVNVILAVLQGIPTLGIGAIIPAVTAFCKGIGLVLNWKILSSIRAELKRRGIKFSRGLFNRKYFGDAMSKAFEWSGNTQSAIDFANQPS
ncbi:hypothetical protein F5Y10DRAFT_264939 [Nemania abortiva]|nr:hypothetical protein F5Y10DRAFT_264939 [Nemania abortiva]